MLAATKRLSRQNICIYRDIYLYVYRNFFFFFFLLTFFNAALLLSYIHGAQEVMRHWYSQYFKSHKHKMNEDTEKREVDESIISLQKKKKKGL